jgi:hypothetical protein
VTGIPGRRYLIVVLVSVASTVGLGLIFAEGALRRSPAEQALIRDENPRSYKRYEVGTECNTNALPGGSGSQPSDYDRAVLTKACGSIGGMVSDDG